MDIQDSLEIYKMYLYLNLLHESPGMFNYKMSQLPIFVHRGQIVFSKAKKKTARINLVSKVIAPILVARALTGKEAVSSTQHPGLTYKRAATVEGFLRPLDDIRIIILI